MKSLIVRNSLLSVVLGLSLSLSASAQGMGGMGDAGDGMRKMKSASSKNLRFSVKAGGILAITSQDPEPTGYSPSPGLSFAAGGAAVYALSDQAALQGELLFSVRNTSYDQGSGASKATVESTFMNLEVPVLGRYNFTDDGTRIYGLLGPTVGLLLSAQSGGALSGNTITKNDVKDSFKSIGLWATGGAGVEMASGLLLEGRYNFALTDAAKEGADTEVKMHSAMLSVGYQFN